jgi:hypothetical protein
MPRQRLRHQPAIGRLVRVAEFACVNQLLGDREPIGDRGRRNQRRRARKALPVKMRLHAMHGDERLR